MRVVVVVVDIGSAQHLTCHIWLAAAAVKSKRALHTWGVEVCLEAANALYPTKSVLNDVLKHSNGPVQSTPLNPDFNTLPQTFLVLLCSWLRSRWMAM